MAYGTILGQTPTPDFPVGGIILWSGSTSNIPTKWHLCDGTNGTPDLRDRFVVGAGSDYSVGDTGGESKHTLNISEMPRHSHTFVLTSGEGSYSGYRGITPTKHEGFYRNLVTSNAGSSQPHNNLPPYYALCYIMKIA